VNLRIEATLKAIAVQIGSSKCLDTRLAIDQLTSKITMKDVRCSISNARFNIVLPPSLCQATTRVVAGLRAVTIEDCTSTALYRHLCRVQRGIDDDVLHVEFTQFNRDDDERAAMSITDCDMSVVVRLARIRFVFLNLWVNRLVVRLLCLFSY
jgi:hypothetical protein